MFFHLDLQVFKQTPGRTELCTEDLAPNIYAPSKLDTDQWMEAAKAMGAKYVIFTAYHSSGFMQWQSKLFDFGLRQTAWRGGKGDVVRDFVDAARRHGLKPGLYANAFGCGYVARKFSRVQADGSPDPSMQRAKTKMIEAYLEELWRNYGELFELWFDGGVPSVEQGGPDIVRLVQKYQPKAVLFQGPDRCRNLLRWIGNETGDAPYPCWSSARHVTQESGTREDRFPGSPEGDQWIPGECDMPLRRHRWFWTPESEPVATRGWDYWTTDELVGKYYSSVGRNCNLLINANINNEGLVPETDFDCYKRFGAAIRARFAAPLAATEVACEGDTVTLSLPGVSPVNQIVLEEDVRQGHRIRAYEVEGLTHDSGWRPLARGSSVGHKRIQMFDAVPVSALRLRVTSSSDTPLLRRFAGWNVQGRLYKEG